MGLIIRAHCEQCGFQQELFAGGGRRDCELDAILSALDEEGRLELEELVELGAARLSIDRLPWACGCCGAIHALPVVSFTLDGERQELWGLCPQCGAEQTEDAPLLCPDCGTELLLLQAGRWD